MISIRITLALTEITGPAGRDSAFPVPPIDMYVCICNAVTDREIRAAVARGATRLEDLTLTLGVGAGCGCCREAALATIEACRHCACRDHCETSNIVA
jgi:bacterioferritin-associated ferredoxin